MTPTTDLATLAARLTRAQKAALLRFSDQWMTSAEAGATGMGATLLCVWRDILAERRWATWRGDRVAGQLCGEGYEYRLNELGLALRQHLMENRP